MNIKIQDEKKIKNKKTDTKHGFYKIGQSRLSMN